MEVSASVINTFMSGGAMRSFLVAVPANLDPKERLPVIFLWHSLGASAKSFYDKGQLQAAVVGQRFLAIIPESKGDLFKWPLDITTSQARMDKEFQFLTTCRPARRSSFRSLRTASRRRA